MEFVAVGFDDMFNNIRWVSSLLYLQRAMHLMVDEKELKAFDGGCC